MAVDIETLQIEISAAAGNAEAKIDSLITGLNKLQTALKGTSEKGANDTVKRLNEIANALEETGPRVQNALSAYRDLGNLKNVRLNKNLSTQIRDVAVSCMAFTDDTIARLEKAADALERISRVRMTGVANEVRDTANTIHVDLTKDSETEETGGESGSDQAQRISLADRLAAAIRGVGIATQFVARQFKTIAGPLFTRPFINGYNAVTKFASGLKGLVSSFKRILMYRAIRTLIKSITSAFREGVNNLYQWSSLFGGEFAQSMDRAATAMQYFKNSIGAAIAPVINALVPILEAVIDKVVQLLNVMNQFFAKLNGAAYWTRAVKSAKKYADATNGAAKATKKLKDYTLGFDELNVFNDKSGAGGSGGGAGTDYGSMFENVKNFDSDIADFAEKFKDAIKRGDWKSAGQLLGNKINSIFASIDWVGSGKKFGTVFGGIFSTLRYTLDTIDFKAIGSHIATWLNNAIANINFADIGALMWKKFTILFDFLVGAISTLDWSLIGNSIGQFLVGSIGSLGDWIATVDWNSLGQSLVNAVFGLVTSIDYGAIVNSFFTLLGSAFAGSIQLLIGLLTGAWENVKKDFSQMMEKTGKEGIGAFFAGILNIIKGVGSWLDKNVFQPFINAFKKLFGIASQSKVMEQQGEYISLGLLDGIKKFINPILEVFSGLWSGIKKIFASVGNWFETNVFNPIGKAFQKMLEPLGSSGDFTGFKAAVNKVIKGINTALSWPFTKINEVLVKIRDFSILGMTPFSGINLITVPQIPYLANGGLLRSGQMFLARENGLPEMVGRIGNQAAVANNGQIEEGIARATERGSAGTIDALFAIANQIIRAIQDNKAEFVIGDEVIGMANARYNQQSGTNGSQGVFANVR